MTVLDAAWAALGEDPAALALVRDHGDAVPLESALPVGRLVHDAIAAASLSAALLAARRDGSAVPTVELDPVRVATAVTSERHFRLDGEPANVWTELSGFWPTADGWVRTHANYPHHRERLLSGLGLPETTTSDELLAHLSTRQAQEIEDVVTAAGGIAVVVRRESASEAGPLVAVRTLGDGPAPEPDEPIRVLDLTRVIAGPVATRTLALWGADVLRVDGPRHPEIEWQHLDGGSGKRSAILDLEADRDVFEALLQRADVVVTGYRPGSLDRYGLSPEALVERRPGLVVARLSAWGTEGPFAGRRGFDSIVQATSGISWLESTDGVKPGALPAQVLDHAAGYLLAAGITTALRRRLDGGGSWLVETTLAAVARQLLALPREPRHPEHLAAQWQPTVVTRGGVTTAAAAPHYDGGPDDWASGPVPWGSSKPEWNN
jgi:crotonobetainyl-CoA:carnitine CoA-transferase CaiB-like acyl-CoA transferase